LELGLVEPVEVFVEVGAKGAKGWHLQVWRLDMSYDVGPGLRGDIYRGVVSFSLYHPSRPLFPTAYYTKLTASERALTHHAY
jgi:hypothetical protein